MVSEGVGREVRQQLGMGQVSRTSCVCRQCRHATLSLPYRVAN